MDDKHSEGQANKAPICGKSSNICFVNGDSCLQSNQNYSQLLQAAAYSHVEEKGEHFILTLLVSVCRRQTPSEKDLAFPSWKERSPSHLTRPAFMAGSFVNGKDSFDHFMQKRRGYVYEAYVPGLNYKTRNFFLPFDVYYST